MSEEYSELDIEITGSADEGQQVMLTFKEADEARSTPRKLRPQAINLDFGGLRGDLLNHESYGNRLRDNVFAPALVQSLFVEALGSTPLRIRLNLSTDDPALHEVRWELMTDLQGAALSSRKGFAFSRFHSSGEEVVLRPSGEQLRALVAVVNPTEQEREAFQLAEIETDFDRRARALGDIQCDPLTDEQGPVTMNRLMDALQQGEEDHGGYDILYLVCHGTVIKDKPHLLFALDTPAEKAKKTRFRSGENLAKRMVEELSQLPRLVVLASCAGAGTGRGDALAATGPLLAGIGIPAVMAMQGYIAIDTVESLLPRFFERFQHSRAVDQAMQSARRRVRYHFAADDWWAPVLFMRLEHGELVYGAQAAAQHAGQAAGQAALPTGGAAGAIAVQDPGTVTQPVGFPKPEPLNLNAFNRVTLYRVMADRLNQQELIDLTFAMGIDYEDLAGANKSAKARELITYCQRRAKVELLLDSLAADRPEWDWYADAGVR